MHLETMGMSVFEAILARRSVRQFQTRTVDSAVLKTLLESSVWAPTAMHQEPWAFIVIQDQQTLKMLSDQAKPLFLKEVKQGGAPLDSALYLDANIFYNASTLIVICSKSNGTFVDADCWLAAENLMLAACAMALGTCVIGSALPALNTPEIQAHLGIPAEYRAIVPLIVGYPATEPVPEKRRIPHILNLSIIKPANQR